MKGFFAIQVISVMLFAQLVYGMDDTAIREDSIEEALLIEKQIEQEEQNRKDKSSQLFFEELDPHWFHEVSKIIKEGQYIKLEDGSLADVLIKKIAEKFNDPSIGAMADQYKR